MFLVYVRTCKTSDERCCKSWGHRSATCYWVNTLNWSLSITQLNSIDLTYWQAIFSLRANFFSPSPDQFGLGPNLLPGSPILDAFSFVYKTCLIVNLIYDISASYICRWKKWWASMKICFAQFFRWLFFLPTHTSLNFQKEYKKFYVQSVSTISNTTCPVKIPIPSQNYNSKNSKIVERSFLPLPIKS